MQFFGEFHRALRWRAAIAVVAGSIILLVPDLVARDPAEGFEWLDVLVLPVLVAFEAMMLILGVRWGTRRGLGTTGAALLAYLLAALFGAAASIAYAQIATSGALCAAGVGCVVEVECVGGACTGGVKNLGVLSEAVSGAFNGIVVAGVWSVFVMTPWAADAARQQSELKRATERAHIAATLEPHFVLNTLNSISSLVVDDPRRARQLLGDLGDLLRDTTRLVDAVTHSLDDELSWLRHYTRIIEARHGHRLEFVWNVDPATLAAHVPTLILQPLLENAIVHGAMQRPLGRVAIHTARYRGRVRVTIADNGTGAPTQPGTGRGLELVRRRLQVDAPGASLELAFGPAGGRAELSLPERTR